MLRALESDKSKAKAALGIDLTRPLLRDVSGLSKHLFHIKWNCDGSYLSAVCADRTVRIYSFDTAAQTLTQIQSISTPAATIQVCWHPLERGRFAFCGDDKALELWDVRSSRASMKVTTLGSNLNMCWSPDGNLIALGNKTDHLLVVDVRTGAIVRKKKFPNEINELAWTNSPEHFLAATASQGTGSITLISLALSQPIHDEREREKEIHAVQSCVAHCANCYYLSLDVQSELLAVSSADATVTLWNVEDLSCVRTITLDSEARTLSFSGDSSILSIGCDENAILMCEGRSGASIGKLATKSKPLMLAWNPLHPVLAMMTDDKNSSLPFLKLICFPSIQK